MKTYHKTLLRYPGGKSRAFNIISNHIPKLPYPDKIISTFMGGGSMEARWAGEWNVPTYGFDIFEHLVNYWNVLLDHPKDLADAVFELGYSKEEFTEGADKVKRSSMTQKIFLGFEEDYPKMVVPKSDWVELDAITEAALYFQNMSLTFGPAFLGSWVELNANEKQWQKYVNRIRNYHNPDLHVGLRSFDKVIPEFPNDLIYLDPPYYLEQDGGNKMVRGLYPAVGMSVHHDEFNHELLRDQLHNHKGPFILSYNDCPTIREYYKDFQQEFPTWFYSFNKGQEKESHEILILKDVEV
jgi:DNA adenine methylase